ncbi:insulinase family protein [Adhaeribacter soli]|uniref:Insulinase family protein n=2 Tax=Adhaeribacter soli TaxID=2607655 RepID=A0A5N1J4P8_9BACT|nr:insulinase family protein [Adhaeribacter soli]
MLFTQCTTKPAQNTAPVAQTTAQPAQKTYTYESVPGDSLKARIYTLDNGLKVYLTQYKDAPRIQTYIAVRAGSKNDPSTATGLAHYLEHMVFKGTSKLGTQNWTAEKAELDKIEGLYENYRKQTDPVVRKKIYHQIDSISGVAAQHAVPNEYDKIMGSLGAKGTNAYTSVEQTVYVDDIPSNQIEKWAVVQAERFREVVPRLFHTELEAVYEEKNRGLDNDFRKEYETMNAALYQKHQYGTQTTIGTIEHLKNPSITEIKKYFDKYYVPNNVAICMSGDFDPDQTIRTIDKYFGSWQKKDVPAFEVAMEDPITEPIKKNVYGPDAENVMIGFRFPGVTDKDALTLKMIDRILTNDQAGLFDLNLNQKQAVLNAASFTDINNDYSSHLLYATPRQGQTLDQAKKLMLDQIELIKKGKFEDWLIPAIVNNEKIAKMKAYESNSSRADAFVTAFIARMDWKDYVAQDEQFAKITKADVVAAANKYYGNNYVAVYKHNGKDPNIQKVDKPAITPVPANRTAQSEFAKNVMTTPSPELQPVFVDYKKDIQQLNLKNNIPVLYTQNKENGLFELYYVLDFGTNNDPKLGLAVNYLKYLGTDKLSAEELQKEFYKLGCSFDVFSSQDQVYVSLRGLNDNFEKGLNLFETFLANAKPDKKALKDLVDGILKEREDAKLSKQIILSQALVNYAKHGPKNPFTNILSEKELKKVKPEELVALVKSIPTYEHRVMYYGPQAPSKLVSTLNESHNTPATLAAVPAEKAFKELDIKTPKVLWVDYNMVQAEIIFLTKGQNYNKDLVPTVSLYNEYFGGNMGSIVFQELRESKALAYSVNSRYNNAAKKDRANYIMSYIGTQSDKLPEAMAGMENLLAEMPVAEGNLAAAKSSIRNSIATERITKSGILFNYERARKLGIDYDLRRDIFQSVNAMTMDDVKKFQAANVKGQPKLILVIGSKDRLNFKELAKYGKVEELKLKDIFGY